MDIVNCFMYVFSSFVKPIKLVSEAVVQCRTKIHTVSGKKRRPKYKHGA